MEAQAGGKVLGAVRHPINASDFSYFLLQAQASRAKIIALASGGSDLVNATKTARELGIVRPGAPQKAAGRPLLTTAVTALRIPLAPAPLLH